MRRNGFLALLAALLLPVPSLAQAPLLLDPAKAPMTLKGSWIHHISGNKNDIVVRIEALKPDGTLTGRMDFYNAGGSQTVCKAINQPIKVGKVTDKMLRLVVSGDNPSACPNIVLVFNPGGEKFLEGKTLQGDKAWLDAPK